MRIDNQDIVRTARQLRDEENLQLHIHPWKHHRHFHLPTWLVATPAAAIIGFVLGIWTQTGNNDETPLTALVDTIYIKEPIALPLQDTIAHAHSVPSHSATVTTPAASSARRTPAVSPRKHIVVGRPVADDHIRYDLLVRN